TGGESSVFASTVRRKPLFQNAAFRKQEARHWAGLPGVARALVQSVLDVQLGAAVACTTFRIVGAIRVGVRRDRAALAVTGRALQAACIDAVAGQVVVHGLGATLGQALVVLLGTDGVGVAGNLDTQIRVTTQDFDRLVQDLHRIRAQGRTVEVEVHAGQINGDRGGR